MTLQHGLISIDLVNSHITFSKSKIDSLKKSSILTQIFSETSFFLSCLISADLRIANLWKHSNEIA